MPAFYVAKNAFRAHEKQLLGVHGPYNKGRCRPFIYSSERFNTRATHIQCCPRQPRASTPITGDFLPTELEPRLSPAMSARRNHGSIAGVNSYHPCNSQRVSVTNGATDTPFLYNGRFGVQTDANGLLFMRARYYSPLLCRFLNADPLGMASGLNWYAYASGNPIDLMDPFGLCPSSAGMDSQNNSVPNLTKSVLMTR